MAKDTQNEFETFAKQKPKLTVLTDLALTVDRAKTSADTFNLRLEVGPVYDIIRYKRTRTPMAILISGGWGTGKTSAMRWLEGLLDIWNQEAGTNDIKVRTVWFYPWKYDNKQDVRRGLIAEVIINSIDVKTASTQTVINAAKQFGLFLGKSFLHVLASIKLKAKAPGDIAEGEVDLASIKEILAEYQQAAHPEKAYLNEFETMLQRWVKNTLGKNERMVIFIDDLDRCMPEISLQVLEALKLYLNIEKLIFVVGVDKQVIEKLVIEHYKKLGLVKSEEGESEKKEQDSIQRREEVKAIQYLAKMFQVEVALEPTEKQISDFFDEQLKELAYWRRPYLSTDEQQLFHDLVLKFAGRNPREVKRLLNSALMTGAGAMMMKKDGIKFDQGLQLFFVRKILDEEYTMASIAGSNRGIEFFVQWSKIVCKGRKKNPDFPTTVKVPSDFGKIPAKESVNKGNGIVDVSALPKRTKTERPDISFAPSEYHELLQNPGFSGLLHLLANEDLGRLMQIPYPTEAAEVVGASKDADIVREAVERRIKENPNENYNNLTALDLHDTGITDLTLVREFSNLQSLDLVGTKVTDVSPLGSLIKMQVLSVAYTKVADVGPLASLTNLQSLDLRRTQVTDVGPLASLTNLQKLYLTGTQVTDVDSLASLTKLQTLWLYDTRVADIGALAGLVNLQSLSIADTDVSDIGALADLTNLQVLYLYGTQVIDIGVLAGITNLQELNFSNTNVSNIAVLSGLTNLQRLDLSGTQVSEIGALVGLTNLQRLEFEGTKVSEIGVLASLTNLQELSLKRTPVSDIDALANLKNLQALYLGDTKVSDEQVDELSKALPNLAIFC